MEIVRPAPPILGVGSTAVAPPKAASAPRPDVPPVTRSEGPAKLAPRPPDQARLGLVQAGMLAHPAPLTDYSPERTLKPWGVAMLPDAERSEALRAERAQAEARRAEHLASAGTAPDEATGEEEPERRADDPPPVESDAAIGEPTGPLGPVTPFSTIPPDVAPLES